MWDKEVKARLLAGKLIGDLSRVAVEVLDLLAALEEIERLKTRVSDLTDQVDYWMGKEQILAARVRELESKLP
jgi:hypothetical protein